MSTYWQDIREKLEPHVRPWFDYRHAKVGARHAGEEPPEDPRYEHPSPEQLRELLVYDEDRGAWFWQDPFYGRHILHQSWGDPDSPPPIPRPAPSRCGCGREHVCSVCGRPYWVEVHGYAAGECTYCYHSG